MKLLYKFIYTFIISMLLWSCNDEITLKTKFTPQIFIFGNLTNETRNLVITIQESVPVENSSRIPKPVKNAIMALYTKDSNDIISMVTNEFIENNENYTSSEVISPIIGNFYWIEVQLQDGTTFKSTDELLKNPVFITKTERINGLIRVSFSDPIDDRNFYRLEVTSTNGNFIFSDYQLSNDVLFNGNDNAFIELESQSGNEVKATLINFNYNTYQFYLNIASQEEAQTEVESGGGDPSELFATPPVHLTGNVLNTSTNKKALGNFGVVSINRYDVK